LRKRDTTRENTMAANTERQKSPKKRAQMTPETRCEDVYEATNAQVGKKQCAFR